MRIREMLAKLRRNMEEREKRPPRGKARLFVGVTVILLSLCLLTLAVLLQADERHVRFYMNGATEITVAYGKPYEEPGVKAVAVGRVSGESKNELPVRVSGEVDTGSIGDYALQYEARTMLRSFFAERLVHVKDTTPPVITLQRDDTRVPNWLEGYSEEGYRAFDDVDGDLTAAVRVEDWGDTRIYSVSDAAGNKAVEIRSIPYSIGRPTLKLEGGEALTVRAGLSFQEPGFHATDARGNDLSAYVRIDGQVMPNVPGEYSLRYHIDNARGETVEAVRTVTVEPLRNPDNPDLSGNVIYLTFDDGPGPFTDTLLDILARYNVKATFFVTARYPDYFDCIGRAAREGHSIGVHSATHDYRSIYASEDAFFSDFATTEALIREQTGSETSICRFPGGSSNTVSRFNRGIMSRLSAELEGLGYRYFDWNVSSGDAGETTSTEQVVNNIIEGCSAQRVSVVLQHDIKDFSVAAVERVIIWGLNNGYVFAPLDETSPTTHHQIAN